MASAPRRVEPLVGLLAAAIVVAFVIHARVWVFLGDDAFITFRYARNLAELGQPVFNPTWGERVEGYTNPAWMVVLAVAARAGVVPEVAAPWLTALWSGLGLAIVVGLATAAASGPTDREGRSGGSPCRALTAIELVPALWLAVSPEYVVWASGGLETAMAATLGWAAVFAYLRARPIAAGGLVALAGLTRPDAVLVPAVAIGTLAAVALLARPAGIRGTGGTADADGAQHPRRGLERCVWPLGAPAQRQSSGPALAARVLAVALAAALLPLALHLLWRHHYYGAWLPNTWAIKTHGALLWRTSGVPYVGDWIAHTGAFIAAPLAVAAAPGWPRRVALALVLAAIVQGAYVVSVGGDFMAYGRLMLPATGCLGAAGGLGLAGLEARARGPARGAWLGVFALLAAAVLGGQARARWQADRAKPEGWLGGRYEGVHAMDRFAQVRLGAGRWLADHVPSDTAVSVGAAGALPYASNLPTIDVLGLVDPELAAMGLRPLTGERARPGHQLVAPTSYIQGRDPDLACHVGVVSRTVPAPRDAVPAFRRGWRWACIPVGPVPDRSSPGGHFDPGLYCCRRPAGRTVGPFSDAAGPMGGGEHEPAAATAPTSAPTPQLGGPS